MRIGTWLVWTVIGLPTTAVAQDLITQERLDELENSPSRLPDKKVPLQYDKVPSRPQPLLEIGNPFMATGRFEENLFLPTGAVFQPSFLLWGTFRTAYNGVGNTSGRVRGNNEWANRLDLFAEYRLSGTERIVAGMRPLDRQGEFFGYDFEEKDANGSEALNGNTRTLFFEGDFGEIFRNLDPDDSVPLDFGFSIGRQPIFFQDGLIVNDVMDSIGITRNSQRFWKFSNFRTTALVGWNNINRGNTGRDRDATLIGLFNEADLANPETTVDFDIVTVISDSAGRDSLNVGAGATQRIGHYNTTFRANYSQDLNGDGGPMGFTGDGLLLTAEVSTSPPHGGSSPISDDLIYLNMFVAIDRYRAAAQGPATGTPLARTGILFAATGIGTVQAPILGFPNKEFGAAFGKQWIFDGAGRQQIIGEVATRLGYENFDPVLAVAGRYQRAFGQHFIFAADLFAGFDDRPVVRGGRHGGFIGTRTELLVKF